ncbi:hypothetical protein B0F90DRAFT_1709234 [Multifurca ochricompacta]|uniref:Coiled-coil domain-containing protein 174 n=1 Tax=Multifurca ochricompacta TaxID=376703 RepID=A0AAD4M923_9AGAM|nr:hypothetical protein B0F90DRAFT_1709234 [Multifurca ochricompacta]
MPFVHARCYLPSPMAPISKAQAAGISSGSFLELRSQVVKQKESLSKDKATGGTSAIIGRTKKNEKKLSKWELPNKGVKNRAARDIELEVLDRRTVESTRAALERKAKIYEKLKKGQSGGLSDMQYDALLVDFDSKPDDPYESGSDDVDESLTVPVPDDDDDPVIEYQDEFGRMRSARRSEVPRHLLPRQERIGDDDDGVVIQNPVNFFPVYEPSSDRVAAITAAAAEENNPLNLHYDASQEVRAKGAGFYQFSADEEKRKSQMEELRRARQETEKTRQELGAVDLKAGEEEGMQGGTHALRNRAIEKRKRDLEERRKAVEAKRRKLQNGDNPSAAATQSPAPSGESTAVVSIEKAAPIAGVTSSAADNFLAALELDLAISK